MRYMYYETTQKFNVESINDYNVRILNINNIAYQIFFKASKWPDVIRAINIIKTDHIVDISSHTMVYQNSNWHVHILCQGELNEELLNDPELQELS